MQIKLLKNGHRIVPERFIWRLTTVRTRQRAGFQEIVSKNRYRTPEGCNSASDKTSNKPKVQQSSKNVIFTDFDNSFFQD